MFKQIVLYSKKSFFITVLDVAFYFKKNFEEYHKINPASEWKEDEIRDCCYEETKITQVYLPVSKPRLFCKTETLPRGIFSLLSPASSVSSVFSAFGRKVGVWECSSSRLKPDFRTAK